MAFDLTKPDMTSVDWPTHNAVIRENFRAIVQCDDNVFVTATPLLDMTLRIRANHASAGAIFSAYAGDGTTSARRAYFEAFSNETTPQRWIFGMNGAKNYVIRDGTAAADRLTIDTSGNIIAPVAATLGGSTAPQATAALDLRGAIFMGGTTAPTFVTGAWIWSESAVGLGIQGGGTLRLRTGGAATDKAVLDSTGHFTLPLGAVLVGAAAPTAAAGQIAYGATTATTATAGANGAPPAQVVGYIIINVAGTARKIPFYAT